MQTKLPIEASIDTNLEKKKSHLSSVFRHKEQKLSYYSEIQLDLTDWWNENATSRRFWVERD